MTGEHREYFELDVGCGGRVVILCDKNVFGARNLKMSKYALDDFRGRISDFETCDQCYQEALMP